MLAVSKYHRSKRDCAWIAGMSRLTEQRGPDSPGARAGSARQSSTGSRDGASSSTSPQRQPSPATAGVGGQSSVPGTGGGDEAAPVSSSSNHVAGGGSASSAVAHPRFSAVSSDTHPQRTSSYHGDFHRRNRLADSPLRAASLDTANRVR